MSGELQRLVEQLAQRVFVGCPPEAFTSVGRRVFDLLVARGLTRDTTVADAGCGALRVGWWLIHYLDGDRYCGIEPRRDALDAAVAEQFGDVVVAQKRPRFDYNDQFDLSVFGDRFDVVVAWSVWTHASKRQIEMLLDSFVATRAEGGWLMANYWPARSDGEDDAGDEWRGQSHESSRPGRTRHADDWLAAAAAARGLSVTERRPWGPSGKQMVVLT